MTGFGFMRIIPICFLLPRLVAGVLNMVTKCTIFKDYIRPEEQLGDTGELDEEQGVSLMGVTEEGFASEREGGG